MRALRSPQVQNVVPNNKAMIRFPLGVTYEKIYLFLGTNITTALISNIVLRVNNKEFQRWATAADLISGLNGYRGNLISSTAFLVIDFTEAKAREEVGMKLGTVAATAEAGVQDFTLEFDLGNYTQVAASTITCQVDIEAPSANPILDRVQYQQRAIASATEEQIYIPFGDQGGQLKRIIIKHANLASVRVRRDGVDIYESFPVALANQRLQDFGRVPQAGYHVVDLMPDSLQSNALNTAFLLGPDGKPAKVNSLDVRVTTSAADTLTIYTQTYASNKQL